MIRTSKYALFLAVLAAVACAGGVAPDAAAARKREAGGDSVATFAGGCFWCMEAAFQKIDDVREVVSGYTGGKTENPTYREVCTGRTGHLEAVQVRYDPKKVSYRHLLSIFWREIDPTDGGGQFADRGSQYHTAIFYHDEVQRRLAEVTKAELERSGKFERSVVTPILPAEKFWPAEEYHQDYFEKESAHYGAYRKGSGRESFIERTWGDGSDVKDGKYRRPSDEKLKERLTPMQFKVTRREGTEPPFENAFWDNKRKGIYVDVVSGEPLFASLDKFKSGTGWPSFFRPLEPDSIVERVDHKLGYARTEVRSRDADSHLGHVFDDGPAPTGLRYCINSAALRFVPMEKLEEQGYGQYLCLFTKKGAEAKK